MKLAVIGGYGLLGSTSAFCAGQKGLFDEIYLIGRKKNVLKSHVMDMDQAMCPVSHTRIFEGEYEVLSECDVILLSASMPEREVSNRNEYFAANREIVRSVAEAIAENCSEKVLLCATNPVDIFNYMLFQILQWDRRRFLGYGYNDTLRLKWALADELHLPYGGFTAYVLGEHGDTQLPIFSDIRFHGAPVSLYPEQEERIRNKISAYFRSLQALNAGRTSGWTSAVGITTLLEAIVKESDVYLPCSAILDGEYGFQGVSMGVPARLGHEGIQSILTLQLSTQERERLEISNNAIKERVNSLSFQ